MQIGKLILKSTIDIVGTVLSIITGRVWQTQPDGQLIMTICHLEIGLVNSFSYFSYPSLFAKQLQYHLTQQRYRQQKAASAVQTE